MTTHAQMVEDFLLDCVAQGLTTFNIAGATAWLDATYPVVLSGKTCPRERHEVSRMVQVYIHAQRNAGSTRAGVFKPSFVVDCDKAGGPNATWTIHQTAADGIASNIRTADIVARTVVSRTVERVAPTLAKDPAAMAKFKPLEKVVQAQVEYIEHLARTL